MDKVASLSAKCENMPLKEPFETAKRRATCSETVMIELSTEGGTQGLGAATPVQYVTGESLQSVLTAVDAAAHLLVGRPLGLFPDMACELRALLADQPSARAGIEMSVIDALGRITGVPSYRVLGGKCMSVCTDVTIPVVTPERAGELADVACSSGFLELKVKVGCGDDDVDFERVMSIVRAAPQCNLILDANQGFTPDDAVQFIGRVTEAGARIAVFEQPVDRDDIRGLAYVTRHAGVPVFADESVCCAEDVLMLAGAGAVNGVNVKLMKSGVLGALEVAFAARSVGLQVMLGCMLEPRVGIAAALHVACAFGEFLHFDLDADLLLDVDSDEGFSRNGSVIEPLATSGLGCGAF